MNDFDKVIREGNLKLLTSLATVQLFTGGHGIEENRRYFSDQDFRRPRNKNDQNMVEYWVPPDKNVKKISVTTTIPNRRPNQIGPTTQNIGGNTGGNGQKRTPKIKEPRGGDNSRKKSSSDKPPRGFQIIYWKMWKKIEKISAKVNHHWQKLRLFRNRIKTNKVAPIHTKVQSRHLELEPLCCLSSCLVRGGCTSVVVFELCYIVLTILCIFEKFFRKNFVFWEDIPDSFEMWFEHPIFYYIVLFYDLLLFMVAISTARALVSFEKTALKFHFYFCFFSFFLNFIFASFSIWCISSPNSPLYFTFMNFLLIFCFLFQLPLQVWAITVVRSCRDFFALIHVFVSLAET